MGLGIGWRDGFDSTRVLKSAFNRLDMAPSTTGEMGVPSI